MKKITLIFISLFILIIGISCASAADLNSSTIADDNYCIADMDIGSVDIDDNGCIADMDIGSVDIDDNGCIADMDIGSVDIDDNDCIADMDIGSVDIDDNDCITDTDIGSRDITTPEIDISSEKTTNCTISTEDSFINDEDMLSRTNTSQRYAENSGLYDLAPQEVTDRTYQCLLEVPTANADWNYLSEPAEPKPFPHHDEKREIDKTTLSSYASALFGIEGLFFILCFI